MQIAKCKSPVGGSAQTSDKLHLRALGFCSLAVLLAIDVPGCKKTSDTVPVHGRVSFRGEPIKGGSVTFFPTTGRPVGAPIQQGEYAAELKPGDYTVALDIAPEFPKGFKEGDPLPPSKVSLPEEYTSRTKSTLKASVATGQSEPIDFDLK
jgi:hypothetical protein